MAAPVRRVRRACQELSLLQLIEQGDEVARLDSQRQRQVSLGDRALGVEVVEDRILGPPQAALPKAPPQAPCGGAGEAKYQQPGPGAQGRIARFGFGLGRCLNWDHQVCRRVAMWRRDRLVLFIVLVITYIP